ncbi:MAG: hypothetical protein H0U60_11870 [Blastocatellia bacterium]|nr:hypothetical protein [Blastocatellia bacterium]
MPSYVPSLVDPSRRVVRVDATESVAIPITREAVYAAIGAAANGVPRNEAGHPFNDDLCVVRNSCQSSQLAPEASLVHRAIVRLEKEGQQTRYRMGKFGQRVADAFDALIAPSGLGVTDEQRNAATTILLAAIGKEVMLRPYALNDKTRKQGSGNGRPVGRHEPVLWRRNGSGQSRVIG